MDDALDDYFDRLDAAFADLNSAPAAQGNSGTLSGAGKISRGAHAATAAAAEQDDDAPLPTIDALLGLSDGLKPAGDRDAAPAMRFPEGLAPAESVTPLSRPAVAQPPMEPAETPAPLAPQPAARVQPAAPSAASVPSPAGASPSAAELRRADMRTSIADAFNALLAAELGESVDDAGGKPLLPLQMTPATAPQVTDELVEDVTRRVIERLAPGLVREVVADVVSELAERLIRDEIARIRHQ
jgi:hypothetical protein